ncbi:tRNA pseudouridine(38-40) synthase TruA [Halobacteriaceae bacterium SHR40]|uniref:tRNA pseudouridine(38-40) synthase TruA n=1 Tax=Halovenus amylolytica TaxID=2500550 RepID=UPI000FE335C7
MTGTRAYRIAYDGRPFHGFQRQPDVATVEGTLLDALRSLDVIESGKTPPGYAAAGRTDAGVSALAQTVGFEAPDWLTPGAFNSELPASIRVWASTDAPPEFHATHDPDEREYSYVLHAAGLDESRTRRALTALSGTQDFHNLTPDDTGTRRTLSTSLTVEAPFFILTLTAGGFARQLVRRIVSLVADVGAGRADFDRIERVLGEQPISGPDGVGPAAAYPLVLTDVVYPALSFQIDQDAATQARKLFDKQRVERTTTARVSRELVDGIEKRETQ